MDEIKKIQQVASEKKEVVRELGVFIFCTTRDGDAWLLEMTDSDAVQLAVEGKQLEVSIDENPETIAINWTHTFVIKDRLFHLTAYADKQKTVLENMPADRIRAAINRIRKKYSEDQLQQVHIDTPAAE
jgi:hypothetical protein